MAWDVTYWKTTWDTLSDDDKSSIISNFSTNPGHSPRRFQPRPKHGSQQTTPSDPTCTAKIHEQNPDDLAQFQAAFHAFCIGNHNNDADQPPMEESNTVQEKMNLYMLL